MRLKLQLAIIALNIRQAAKLLDGELRTVICELLMKTRGYRQLEVWKFGIELADEIYNLTENFPKSQIFSLVQQLQRAAVSVSSNIAEGYNRNGKKEFYQFLNYARGSVGELDTQLEIANNRNFISSQQFHFIQEKCDIISKMIWSLQQKLKVK